MKRKTHRRHGGFLVRAGGDLARQALRPDRADDLTYSLSTNPRSPFFSDQTAMFNRKRWVAERFCASDVKNHTVTTTGVRAGSPTKTVRNRRAARRHHGRRRSAKGATVLREP